MTPPRSSRLKEGSNALSARSRSLRSHISPNSFSSPSTATRRDPLGIRRQRFGGQFSLRRGIAWSSSQGRELDEYNKWASPGNCPRRPAASNYLLSLVSETARTHGGRATGSWRQKCGERSLAEKWTLAALLSETGFPRSWSSPPPPPHKPPGYFRKSRQAREQAHPRSQYPGPRHQAGLQSTARPVILAALFCHPPTAPSQMSVGQRPPFAPRTQTGARAHMAVRTARCARPGEGIARTPKAETGQQAGLG